MSRIIAGHWKGHPLPVLHRGPVRPTSSRTRTVLFDTLPPLSQFHVLDLFSGTGSLGFEALSRGARHLTSVDKRAGYLRQQREWIMTHDAQNQFDSFAMEAGKFLTKFEKEFHLILLDPPYDLELGSSFWAQLVRHLNSNSWLVYECGQRAEFEMQDDLGITLYKSKKMGDSMLHFYTRGNA
ncbi:MAG: RsmD family RNA methyltransferase [Candidatus Marinimicrobia bacterium]|nr:RsmD family RNA methyltransferase [Candidatus Neomarinimicrobiota bacterium]MCF7839183.1 RsmD family RNA methyltransferase [Candidatus Neomarinimicrobiota bacterium]